MRPELRPRDCLSPAARWPCGRAAYAHGRRGPVSVEAISRALNLAPVPADRGGQPSSACKVVLVGLANHAGPDGSGAFPAVHTLMRYTGLSERTVRACLGRLEAAGLIRPCDPGGRGGADQAGRPAA